VHDLYYPYVGLENHSAGRELRHKVGVWVDGQICWLDDGSWNISLSASYEFLGGNVKAQNESIGITLEFNDIVDSSIDVFLRSIQITNTRDIERDIRLFMHQAFVIGDSRSNTDTAQFLPDNDAIVHYRGRRVFIIGAKDDDERPFDQFSIGIFGIEGREGSYRDADDGELQGCTVEHGRVDSTIRFAFSIEPNSTRMAYYWLSAGETLREALLAHKSVDLQGYERRHHETVAWWHKWLEPTVKAANNLPESRRQFFIQSALIVKSHIDNRGAIIASTDTAMLNYWRDVYGYCWPRDGAYALWPLIRLGYTEEPLNYFRFFTGLLHPKGYLMHKYRADGALGSSWHPYVHGDTASPPIQEDETAIMLFIFAQYYHMHPDAELLDEFYNVFVKPMANFLAQFIDDVTHLPKPSYDLWEEVYATSTYTTSVVHAALLSAAELADIRHDDKSAVSWRSVAEDIQIAAKKHLYNPGRRVLRKGIFRAEDSNDIEYNDTIDLSSFYGCFMFGLFDDDSEELATTAETIRNIFLTDPNIFTGLPRYENDNYLRQGGKAPNPWFITSLWLAQYYTERDQPEKANEIINWVEDRASSTSHLSEQTDQDTKAQLSVSPLVWSHAEYMATLLDTVAEKL
jgi:GH15 family glucan-1,4-alpha-glucosidase